MTSFRRWGREGVFVSFRVRDLYYIQHRNICVCFNCHLLLCFQFPVVISSITNFGAGPKAQIFTTGTDKYINVTYIYIYIYI